MSAHEFLLSLTVVLGVAGITTVLFQRLHQPVVLGYILAGLVIGPHLSVPIVADPFIVTTLSELGVILLMFGIGLELDLGKLFRVAPTAGVIAILECSLMTWFGFVAATLMGWSTFEAIFTGAIVAISSTTIIAKAFEEQGISGNLRQLVLAILIVEDVIAVLLMALLTGVATGRGVSAEEVTSTVLQLVGFLVALVALGLLVVPRVMRAIVRLGRNETIVVAAIGVCFAISLLAREFGYSIALGAFVAGVLVGESGNVRQIEPLVRPVRDIFVAVFFVAVGMQIDPAQVAAHWVAIVVLTAIVVAGKMTSVSIGAFLSGKNIRTAVSAGMSLAQIGEFSFIIATLGVSLGVVGSHLYAVAVSVSAITTLLTPTLIKRSSRFASFIDRHLPQPLQTVASFYGSWMEKLRASRAESRSLLRRFARTLALDVAVIAGVLIATSLSIDSLATRLVEHVSVDHADARLVVVIGAGLLVLPFCVSVLRTTHRFGQRLGEVAIPRRPDGSLDLGRQPRLVIEAAVRFIGILIAGATLVAITQPFLPGWIAGQVLLAAIVVLAILFWRTATGLQGHVRAAAQAVIEVLAAQRANGAHAPDPLEQTHQLFPGLGAPIRLELATTSPAVGRTLAELDLRSATGATVLAIVRGSEAFAIPDAHEPLAAGDVLALAGPADAVAAAVELLSPLTGPRRRSRPASR